VSDRTDRAHAALTDVVAVEHHAPGMVRVVSTANSYVVDARHERCECPDYQYRLDGQGRCKHLYAALDAVDKLDLGRHALDESLTTRVACDGGGEWTVRGEKPTGDVVEQTAESRPDAEQMRDNAEGVGLTNVEIIPPDGSPEPDTDADRDAKPDGGESAEVVAVDADAEAVDVVEQGDGELPDRSVADDPLTWMPGEFVDDIDGSQAINRKGFEVLGHFYDVEVSAELQVAPEETDHEYARVKATATTADGREVEAFGSAHVDRGDDPWLLLKMADTRARKRALSVATGAGAVAVEELKNEVER
jgi:hypothetical protein